ncbi:ferrous iron transport protein B, partial [Christensenellaceae bacterium OttesenSCG-928-M15]|nr:ferrous iron transport protein B [Christensenellaceae bacterium OttesenSCG-928-M15]
STVFNMLTGMNQHTGNWPGKTVGIAKGTHEHDGISYLLVDLPGTYSLLAHSAEEEIARDFIVFGEADATIVVCDATCLERNLNLVLQTLEITEHVVVCVNLMDEAAKKGISIDLSAIENALGVPVVGASARANKGLEELMEKTKLVCEGKWKKKARRVRYSAAIETAISGITDKLDGEDSRFLALRLLEDGASFFESLHIYRPQGFEASVMTAVEKARAALSEKGISGEALRDCIVRDIVFEAEQIHALVNKGNTADSHVRDRKLDRILTSKRTGIPIMIALLFLIFYITIIGANDLSDMLAKGLFYIQDRLTALFMRLNAPKWLHGALVLGVYRVLAWVVSVMLPPMAIFFPLFTLLEDFGYLPRVAFNLDHQFKKAKACGKQSLTMCMGFGCNAAGVTGCRIIDSPRERLIAIITNSFVPCNGRFPTLITIISIFFVGTYTGVFETLLSSVILCAVILLGVGLTFLVSRFLSETLLKGEPSSFTLELPPYRTPQIGKVIVRSLFDRTIFVLGRAAAVAAPAGLVIWLLANITVGDVTLLAHCANFLDPFGRALGMDGVIMIAFILGFPANEIVIPIMLMAYLSTRTIEEMAGLAQMKTVLLDNGWTWVTAVSTMLFCLIHWPCSTTCLTIKKETGSAKWTALSIALPTAIGMAVCFFFTSAVRLLGFS